MYEKAISTYQSKILLKGREKGFIYLPNGSLNGLEVLNKKYPILQQHIQKTFQPHHHSKEHLVVPDALCMNISADSSYIII